MSTETFVHSLGKVRRLFSVGLWSIAFLWLIVVPSIEVWQRYSQARVEAQIRLSLVADRISSYVAANLDIWEFEQVRLPSVVSGALRGSSIQPSRLAFITKSGEEIKLPSSGPRSVLTITLTDTVSDGYQPVGHVVMDIGFDGALLPAMVPILFGLTSVGLLMFFIRLVGRKALDRSLAVITETGDRLIHQIEELDAARAQLAVQSKNLKMANEDIAHVAQLAAHHLREPLRIVLSYSQLLLRWHSDAESDADVAESYIQFIRVGTDRMQGQLDALSSYLGMRENGLEVQPVSLEEALSKAVDGLSGAMTEAGARVEWGCLPVVSGNMLHLSEVFRDLLLSALRYRRPNCPLVVQISAEDQDGFWCVKVRDNGVPLGGRDEKRMFDLLVHGEGGRMIRGLASARLVLFLLGGSMWVEACADNGVALCFDLPEG